MAARVEIQIVSAQRQELIVQPQLTHMQNRQAAAREHPSDARRGLL